jgi:phosphate starvation-inducible PhoH-like protein
MKPANRKRKSEVTHNVELTEEQQTCLDIIRDNQIAIITGAAGTGKSLVCAYAAMDYLSKSECDTVFVSRPAVEVGKTLGFIPGDLSEKLDPYTQPLIENMTKVVGKTKIGSFLKDSKLIGLPIQFIRGHTIDDLLIVDEAQNTTEAEMEAILTRLGKDGKILIVGDTKQKDIDKKRSGIDLCMRLLHINGIRHFELKENHRSGIVKQILLAIHG